MSYIDHSINDCKPFVQNQILHGFFDHFYLATVITTDDGLLYGTPEIKSISEVDTEDPYRTLQSYVDSGVMVLHGWNRNAPVLSVIVNRTFENDAHE